jgi:putative transposase
MRRAYRLRFYPSPRQERQLAREFGAARWVWNFGLAEMSIAWRERQERVRVNEISRRLTELKAGEKPWLREVTSTTLTQSLRDLDRAFQNLFAKRAHYPRFKKRRVAQAVRYQLDPRQRGTWIAGERLVLPKLGVLNLVWSRIPSGRPLMVTVRRDTIRRYFVSFSVEETIAPLPQAIGAAGVDLGLHSPVVLSDGTKVAAPRHLRRALRVVRHRSRVVARRVKGSGRRERARGELAKAHAKVADSRQDWLHKLTSTLVRENQTLVVEDLNVAGMVRNRHLALSLSDGALAELQRQLEYKCAFYGRTFVRVGRFFPSTKKCSVCGFVLEALALREREWTCPECGSSHDRDVNAARNLLHEGLRILTVPPGGRELMRVEGGNPRPYAGHSVKRESHEIEAPHSNAAPEIS